MTNYIEFEGKNLEKALKKASDTLNKPVDKLKYDVVSYGSSGIFGLVGTKKAKIRVKTAGRDEIQKDARQQARDLVKDAFNIEGPDSQAKSQVKSEVKSELKQKVEQECVSPVKPVKAERHVEVTLPDAQAVITRGEEVLRRIIDCISEGSTIKGVQQDGRIVFQIESGNSALIIGKRGQTLEALQYLVEKIINKQNDQRVRILVDVEGYLETRKENLIKMASRMADKAQRINKPVTIGQMNAYDRRVVHLHLKENQAVRTQSMGEGYYRKLVIFPKKRRRENRQAN
jgi:spoIIIJ-associated protein